MRRRSDGDDESLSPRAEAAQYMAIGAKMARVAMETRMVLLAWGLLLESSYNNDEAMMKQCRFEKSLDGRFL